MSITTWVLLLGKLLIPLPGHLAQFLPALRAEVIGANGIIVFDNFTQPEHVNQAWSRP